MWEVQGTYVGHMLTTYSFDLADQALFANREVFQNQPYELTMIFGSLIVHGATSWLIVYKRGALSPLPNRLTTAHAQLHRWSGYVPLH